MARNSVPMNLSRMHLTKQEKAVRLETENRLRGAEYDPTVPEEFSPEEAAAYVWLCEVLKPADILGEPDRETMKLAAVTIARLEAMDQMMREDPDLLTNKEFNRIRSGYFAQYLQLCKELCLSPAGRAKIGSIARNKKSEDPLIKIIQQKK